MSDAMRSRLLKLESREQLLGRHQEWCSAALQQESLYATPEWILSLWESHYGMTGVDFFISPPGDCRFAVIPLRCSRIRKFGLPFNQVALISNAYANDNTLLIDGTLDDGVKDLASAMRGYDWDWLTAESVLCSSRTEELLRKFASSIGAIVTTEPHWRSPYMPIVGTWDAFLSSRSSNFRSDMKRKWNKAIGAGVEFREVTGVVDVQSAIDEVLAIESRSWKQGAGSSIGRDSAAARFYRIFLPKAAERGWLNLHLLYVKGVAVAYDMGVTLHNRYYMLKTSFDDTVDSLSPGVVIRQHVVKGLFDRGVVEHDFMGDADPYKLRWTSLEREHLSLRVYNPARLRTRLYNWLRSKA
jgi:CelD/BcsL family acetyltransferase involved in cellulose biosynthesis